MKIEPGRIINDFIEPNKHQYAIPVYQRNYEWSKEQCEKLFRDIVDAYKKDRTHFCGSVVHALLKEEHNIYYHIIIDGQQRLTTIYIMLKALLDLADTDAKREAFEEAVFNKDKFDTLDVDKASKLKLKPIKTDNNQLMLLMDAEYYHAFLYGNSKYSDKVNSTLDSLQKLKQTTVFLFLFRVFDDYDKKVINQGELEKVLQFLLNYSIRRLICEIGSNSLRGLYKTLYSRIFAREENKQCYYDAIVSFFMQLTSKDALPDDEMFITALKQNNLYRKNALCKYLLGAIENQGKEQLVTDNLTIEHIMPQNKNLSTAWQNMLGDNWQNVRDTYLHTLGNLTLTGYNSELGDKAFEEKKELLATVHTKVVILYEDVKDCDAWNAEAIESRANNLANMVVALFPIVQPEKEVSFADPRYKEYTCDEPDEATYKSPNYYILQGERVNTNNFADMLRSIISRLYAIDKTIIEDMARKNERLLSWSQIIMFSYDVEQTSRGYKISGTDIYASTGFSAAHIMYIVRALLDKYDIERSDFVYSARSNKPVSKDKE